MTALALAEVAAITLVGLVARAMRFARESVQWPTHPARVLAAEAIDLQPMRGMRWLRLYYRYSVAGREYVRTRYQFAHMWLTFGAIRRVAAELTANPEVHVYVDPADPRRATLRAGVPGAAYVLAVLSWLLLIVVSALLLVPRW